MALTVASSASTSVSARKPTRPRFTPSNGTPAVRVSSAARRNVPSPPSTRATSVPLAPSGPSIRVTCPRSPPGTSRARSAASTDRIRTSKPARFSRWIRCRASSRMSGRPQCTTSSADLMSPPWSRCGSCPARPVRRPGGARERIPRCRSGRAAGCARRRRCPSPAGGPPAATACTASARWSGSRTTPPLPSRSRPTSNCGLTIGSRSSVVHRVNAGSTRVSEMKDRSATVSAAGPPICSGVRVRTLVRSCTSTRGSDRSDQASWP